MRIVKVQSHRKIVRLPYGGRGKEHENHITKVTIQTDESHLPNG